MKTEKNPRKNANRFEFFNTRTASPFYKLRVGSRPIESVIFVQNLTFDLSFDQLLGFEQF